MPKITPKDIQLAEFHLNKVRSKIKSYYDVISFDELPVRNLQLLQDFARKSGINKNKAKAMMTFKKESDELRFKINKLCEADKTLQFPNTTAYVTTAGFGLGECAEMSNTLAIELLRADFPLDISLFTVTNDVPIHQTNDHEIHGLVIVGTIPPKVMDKIKTVSLAKFFELINASCLVLDPLFKIVLKPLEALEKLKPYLSQYNIHKIHSWTFIGKEFRSQLSILDAQVNKIKTIVLDQQREDETQVAAILDKIISTSVYTFFGNQKSNACEVLINPKLLPKPGVLCSSPDASQNEWDKITRYV